MLLSETTQTCVHYVFTVPPEAHLWLWIAMGVGALLLLLPKTLGPRILGGMLVGAAVGSLAGSVDAAAGAVSLLTPVGNLFLRLLKMLVIPLVLFSMTAGVLGAARAGRVGPLAGRTVGYYLLTTTVAVIIGLVLVTTVRPGDSVAVPEACQEPRAVEGATSFQEILFSFIPSNPFEALAAGDVLPVIFWGLLLGAGIAAAGPGARVFGEFFEGAFEAVMKVTHWIIQLAPWGVLAILAHTVSTRGLDLFRGVGSYMVVVIAGLAVHALVVLPIILYAAGRKMHVYASVLSPALLNAFSTASSSATLPLTMEQTEKAGVSERVRRFLLPLGATINMDGTALYEAVAVVFIAQVYGVEMSLGNLVIIALTATLASIGAAGIPEAGLVTMVLVLSAVGLPLEGTALILGVDWFLDRCRTTVNVWGDAVGAAVVDRLEKT